MQEVLFWQTCTLRMMFKIVGDALAEVGRPDKHPGDYLIFLTVGTLLPPPACGVHVHARPAHGQGWRFDHLGKPRAQPPIFKQPCTSLADVPVRLQVQSPVGLHSGQLVHVLVLSCPSLPHCCP